MDGGTPNQPETPWQFSNGTSSASTKQPPQAAPAAVVPAAPAVAPGVQTTPLQPVNPTPSVAPSLQEPSNLLSDAAPAQVAPEDAVEWTASEFVARQKSSEWYAMLAIITVAVALIVYFLTKDILSGVVVIMLGAFAAFAANRQPSVLPYRLDVRGLTVGARFYPYNAFKSFYIIDEGAFSSITMMPSGGFMPELSIYYSPEDEHDIIEVLGEHLPMEQNQGTYVDRLARRFHF